MAYWGLALDLLGNTLSAPPSPRAARDAWELLEKARALGAKTERERAWIEAIRSYYRDHDKLPVDTRLLGLQPGDASSWPSVIRMTSRRRCITR